MSVLWIETDKGRVYIDGDDAVEMIVPPGEPYRLSDRQPPEQVFPRETEKEKRMYEQAMEMIKGWLKKAGTGVTK